MPFFLYGSTNEPNIDHILLKNPNVQLSSSGIRFVLNTADSAHNIDMGSGVVVILDDMREFAMQPYGRGHYPRFFASGMSFTASVYQDPFRGQHGIKPIDIRSLFENLKLAAPLAHGTLTLGKTSYVDDTHINRATLLEVCITPTEQLTRDELLLSVTENYEKIKEDIERVISHHNVIAATDATDHIMKNAVLPEKYTMKRTDAFGASALLGQPIIHLSRFALRCSSDRYSRQMAVRKGWKDLFDSALLDSEIQSANGPVM